MAEKNKSKTDLQIENLALRAKIATMQSAEWSKTVRWLIAGSALVLGLYFIAPTATAAITALAGKTTKADFGIDAKIKADINKAEEAIEDSSSLAGWLGFIFGSLGLLYGNAQSRLRKNVVEKYQPYKEMYEKDVDSKRSSSDLTTRGETRPEDK